MQASNSATECIEFDENQIVSGVVVYNVRVVFENFMRLFLITKQLNRAEQFRKPSSVCVFVLCIFICTDFN